MKLIKSKENEMNNELVSKYFFVPKLGNLLKQMKDLKNNPEKNRVLVNIIKSRIKDLKNEIEKMTEDEIKTEKPDEIVDIAKKTLKFKEQQENEGLNILMPSQVLSRLPIFLARLKAGNNSGHFKNDIIQLLYPLYRSKKLTK